jgi:hypothetical protein
MGYHWVASLSLLQTSLLSSTPGRSIDSKDQGVSLLLVQEQCLAFVCMYQLFCTSW